MAMEQKSIVGAILFLVIFNAVQFIVRFGLMYWSYGLGTKAVTMLTSNAKEFTRAASILGIFVVGALIANYGSTTLRLIDGETQINVQGLLDGVVLSGGDGTISNLVTELVATGADTPLLIFPSGTANLFFNNIGNAPEPAALARACRA